MWLFSRLSIGVALVIMLAACHQQYKNYQYLYQNPDVLQSRLGKCQTSSGHSSTPRCEMARIAKQVIDAYMALQTKQGTQYFQAQQKLMQFHKQLKAAENNKALREKLIARHKSELSNYGTMFLSVQEGFGKLIMAQEAKFAKLKAQQEQLKQKLSNSQGDTPGLNKQLKQVKHKLQKTHEMIQAMLAFVGMYSSE